MSHPVTAAPTLEDVLQRLHVASTRSRTVVLVEGASDRAALLALARRQRRDLSGAAVVAVGGAASFGHALEALARTPRVRVIGMCDAPEEVHLRRGLARAGDEVGEGRQALAQRGFWVCVEDLEDELVRALGVGGVVDVVTALGELASYRRFCAQPAQRGREEVPRLRRFLATRAGRKVRYGAALVEALDEDRVPTPLREVLAHV